LYIDGAAHYACDDIVGNVQAESAAALSQTGREEWFENMTDVFFGNATAIIAKLNADLRIVNDSAIDTD
jgi:hypothetical protein